LLDPRDPLLHSERTQGFAADPDYWKGEVFAYVGLPQNLKDLKAQVYALLLLAKSEGLGETGLAWLVPAVRGIMAVGTPPPAEGEG
jgi:hypothetical protein